MKVCLLLSQPETGGRLQDTSCRVELTLRALPYLQYPLLTSGMLGVQAVWTIEMSQGAGPSNP